MTVPAISNLTHPNVFSTEKYLKLQAIEIFGQDLAKSLKIKDRSWEKVITSWNVFHAACTIIKHSNIYFSSLPEVVHCDLQSDNGLIFDIVCDWNKNSITTATLITPFGCIDIQCNNTETMGQFIKSLEEKFFTKFLQDPNRRFYTEYSFTLSPEKTASFKSLYDVCDSLPIEEMGKFAFTRSQVADVCTIAKKRLNMEIRGWPILPKPPQYVSIGIQAGNSYTRQIQNYNHNHSSNGYDTC